MLQGPLNRHHSDKVDGEQTENRTPPNLEARGWEAGLLVRRATGIGTELLRYQGSHGPSQQTTPLLAMHTQGKAR